MKKNNRKQISSMQVEVWKMKDRVYEETKKMNYRQFFNYLKNKSRKFIVDHRNPVEPSCQKEK
jgi:uncharacterized membrane protein